MVSFLKLNLNIQWLSYVYSFNNEDQTLKPFNEDKSKKDYFTNDFIKWHFIY